MSVIRFENVRVHARSDTENKLTLGIAKADPYVIFRLGGAEVQTPVAEEAGKNARWGGVSLRGANLSQASELVVTVKDENTGRSDSYIGEGRIPVRDLQDGRLQVVRLSTSSRGDAGELAFTVDAQGALSSYSGGGGGSYQAASTTTSTGYASGQTSELRQYKGNPVCDTKTYSTTEDRPVTREVIERVVEHRPVQKQFVVETRPVGERELIDQRYTEVLGTTERIVRVTPPSEPCAGGPTLEGVRGGTSSYTHHGHHHGHHSSGTTTGTTSGYTDSTGGQGEGITDKIKNTLGLGSTTTNTGHNGVTR